MKRITQFSVLCIMAVMVLFGNVFAKSYPATNEDPVDRTLSPYFFVKSDDPALDRLPLKATSVNVSISGVIADVRVTQVYRNEGRKAVEAIYVFPASTRAAVYGMKMTIGKRVIEAKIQKRDDARRTYEEARRQGKSASLLEQQRPNVFQMNVANIMPGDEIRVHLSYTEFLVPEDRVYEFVYPTVVGPRYSDMKADSAPATERWVENPYLRERHKPFYGFDITVSIAAGMPIGNLVCMSHKVNAVYSGPSSAQITLDGTDKNGGNRDYVLRYRLDGDKVQSGLLLFEGEKEKFFLLMVQPPKRVARRQVPGREYIFIVDVSGSMYGFPLDISKKLLKDLIGNLRATDRFNVMLFSGGSTVMSEESLPATAENVNRAVALIDRQRGGGGTELLPALQRALALKKAEGFSRSVVVVTDGYVTVEEEVFDLIRKNLNDANMFTFGIGSAVNRHIIEGMARVGMGEPFIITKKDEAPAQADKFRRMIETPVLTDVKVKFNGFNTYEAEPLSVPDVLADRPVIVFGKWRGKPRGKITISGIAGNGKHMETIDVATVKPDKAYTALRYLWARHRIMLLSDYNKLRLNDKRVREVTELGLTYNLLTACTSFVAVDSEVRNKDSNPTEVKQPLPLPEGVSNYAVGYGAKGGYASRGSLMAMAPVADPSPGVAYERRAMKKDESFAVADRTGGGREPVKAVPVKVSAVTAVGGLTKDQVRSVLEKKLAEIMVCIPGGARSGTITLKFTVNADGTVRKIVLFSSTLKNMNIEKCVSGTCNNWVFSKAGNGKETKATIILVVGP